MNGGIWELQTGAGTQGCESLEMSTARSAVSVGRLSSCVLTLQALGV